MLLLRRFALRLLALFRSGRADHDLSREIDSHLQLLEDGFAARGMSRDEARYAARRAFGGVEQTKERHRDERTFRSLAGWSMDLKLGARMLVKYPGLTIVGGIAMAFAIAVSAAGFEVLRQLVAPALPLENGDEIVALRHWDTASNREEPRTVQDFLIWRDGLKGIEDLGAFRTVPQNLILENGSSEPVDAAEISATAFRVARVQPLLGRTLVEADEQPGAPHVVVIGHEVWQRHLGGDPAVLGRTIRLGNVPTTIVGVMPAAFAFPVSHRIWVPLRLNTADIGRREGPAITVFGRLAPGTTIDEARAEVSALGARASAAFPDTHAHLRPEVLPYARGVIDVSETSIGGAAVNLAVLMFLALVCANVGALVFARAVTRHDEILVRTALGASRGRIVMQIFAETLVLGSLAAAIGLLAARGVLEWWISVYEAESGGRLPFWFGSSISPLTALYTAGLMVLGAAIAGVFPALKITGRKLEGQLRQASAGTTPIRFSGVWTAVIIGQIAVTVAFPATAFFARRHVVGIQSLDVGFPADQYLSARLAMDQDGSRSLRDASEELERRLSSKPEVAGVTFTTRLPRTSHPSRPIEVDRDGLAQDHLRSRPDLQVGRPAAQVGRPAAQAGRYAVNVAGVAFNYFETLGAPVLSGRAFTAADLDSATPPVIVNESFVARVLGGRNPIGQRVRYAAARDAPAGPWREIVGLVKDLGTIQDDATNAVGMYYPLSPGSGDELYVALHLKTAPDGFASDLRATAAAVEPALLVDDVLPLDRVGATLWMELDFLFKLLTVLSAVALLLALAGIFSVMSFTVSRRTREIGIRLALGADARRIVRAILSRVFGQVAAGVAIGGALVFALTRAVTGLSAAEIAVVTGYMVVMFGVCLLACIGPALRALRVEPTEALRAQ